jgi:hypothetical protein
MLVFRTIDGAAELSIILSKLKRAARALPNLDETDLNFFSSDEFLTSLADVYAPGRRFRIGFYRTDGRLFRLLSFGGHAPVTRWDFLDSVEPFEGRPDGPVEPLAYLPLAVLGTDEVTALPEHAEDTGPLFPAPYVDWSLFDDWKAFQDHFAHRRPSLVRDSRQKRRHLESEIGPLSFVLHDARPAVFDQCIAWKSAQYLRTGVRDMFSRAQSAELFRRLERKGVLLVSSLSAGGRLLAVHFGALSEARFYSWIAAYDPSLGRYSPGRLLLEDLLRERQARGDHEFDFGIGNSDYKWHYATHNRTIGPLGRPRAAARLGRRARSSVKRVLQHWPGLLSRVQRLRLRLHDRGVHL